MKIFSKILVVGLFIVTLLISVNAADFTIGDPVTYKAITIFPVLNKDTKVAPKDYLSLEEATKEDLLVIVEVSEGGTVNTLKATNRSRRPIYIMAGEIIEGAKQNRTIGIDIIIKPLAKNVKIPVFCVEQGRWTYQEKEFKSKNQIVTAKVRSAANNDGSQSAVWENVAKQNEKLGTKNKTGNYTEIYNSKEISKKIKQIKAPFLDLPANNKNMVGVVVYIGTDVVLDVFGNRSLFLKKWDALLEAYVIDAIDVEISRKLPSRSEAEKFLQEALTAKSKHKESIHNTDQEKVDSKKVKGTRVKDEEGNDLHLNFYNK
ncbi:hypothetical protein KAU33_03460 [Candidatus Dependentiae bacterium]|nr:hypothetical protein [Candidatus Dependentiae bacterium]